MNSEFLGSSKSSYFNQHLLNTYNMLGTLHILSYLIVMIKLCKRYSRVALFSIRIHYCVFSFFGTPLDHISQLFCLWEWVTDVSHLCAEVKRAHVFSPHTLFYIHCLKQSWSPNQQQSHMMKVIIINFILQKRKSRLERSSNLHIVGKW